MQDQLLIEAVHRGDRDAFASIVERYHGAVYGYLRARLLEPSDAEDLTQEVFLRCCQGKARFDSSAMILPWLIGVARNVLREHIRKMTRRNEVAWTELCLALDSGSKAETSMYDDVIDYLPECLGSLGPSAREALDLRYQAKLRLAKIGERLHRSEGAVKLLMYRARAALRHCLDGKLRGETND
ncbi:MAG: sigma-70 family RNA polymerase sigma factor [Planctomycetes bacterium]|nr:sigma-70 family RNA polymerase sigma factor [Planctomycetota bacterium]